MNSHGLWAHRGDADWTRGKRAKESIEKGNKLQEGERRARGRVQGKLFKTEPPLAAWIICRRPLNLAQGPDRLLANQAPACQYSTSFPLLTETLLCRSFIFPETAACIGSGKIFPLDAVHMPSLSATSSSL